MFFSKAPVGGELSKFRKHIVAFNACLLLLASSTINGQTLRLAHTQPVGSLFDVSSHHFAGLVERRSQGRTKVQVFPMGQLGSEGQMLQAVRGGTIDIGLKIHSSELSELAPELQLFDLPYIVRNRNHARQIADRLVLRTIAPKAEQRGIVMIGVWEYGFRYISSNRRPITGPEDLRGLKITSPGNPWASETFQKLGAAPVSIPVLEVQAALERGVIDAYDGTLSAFLNRKLYESQKYLSLTLHNYVPGYVLMNTAMFQRLDPAVRRMIEASAADTQTFALQEAEKMEREHLNRIRGFGVTIVQVDQDRFRRPVSPIYDEFARKVPGGYELIRTALQLEGMR